MALFERKRSQVIHRHSNINVSDSADKSSSCMTAESSVDDSCLYDDHQPLASKRSPEATATRTRTNNNNKVSAATVMKIMVGLRSAVNRSKASSSSSSAAAKKNSHNTASLQSDDGSYNKDTEEEADTKGERHNNMKNSVDDCENDTAKQSAVNGGKVLEDEDEPSNNNCSPTNVATEEKASSSSGVGGNKNNKMTRRLSDQSLTEEFFECQEALTDHSNNDLLVEDETIQEAPKPSSGSSVNTTTSQRQSQQQKPVMVKGILKNRHENNKFYHKYNTHKRGKFRKLLSTTFGRKHASSGGISKTNNSIEITNCRNDIDTATAIATAVCMKNPKVNFSDNIQYCENPGTVLTDEIKKAAFYNYLEILEMRDEEISRQEKKR